LEEHETAFVATMNGLILKGVDFGFVVRSAMNQTMGSTQTEIILAMVGESCCTEPGALVKGLSAIFGDGARSVFDSVVAEARTALLKVDAPGPTVFEQLTVGMKPLSKGNRSRMQSHSRETRFDDEDS
jgi:hypothetical protein